MTPHELNLHIDAYRERMEREGESDLVTAYLTAYYHRVKKMPDIKKLLEDSKPKPKVKQSDEAMLAMIKSAHTANGGITI